MTFTKSSFAVVNIKCFCAARIGTESNTVPLTAVISLALEARCNGTCVDDPSTSSKLWNAVVEDLSTIALHGSVRDVISSLLSSNGSILVIAVLGEARAMDFETAIEIAIKQRRGNIIFSHRRNVQGDPIP